MRFGICCSRDNFSAVKSAGYDYAEVNLSALEAMTGAEFTSFCEASEKAHLPVEAANCFFTPDCRLVGADAWQADEIAAYAERALGRAEAIGVKTAVIGSGRQRNVPEDCDRAEALSRFGQVLSLCGDIAGRHGVIIVLEPLNKGETNLINSVAEGHALCEQLQHPQVRLLADFYHLFMENEPVDNIPKASEYINHVHISRPNADRRCPGAGDVEASRSWPEALKKAGYDGRLSLECSFSDFDRDIRSAWEYLQMFR